MEVTISREKLSRLKDALEHVANECWLDITSSTDAAALLETIACMKTWLEAEEE